MYLTNMLYYIADEKPLYCLLLLINRCLHYPLRCDLRLTNSKNAYEFMTMQ